MAKRPTPASLKKVNAENLAALGAERLAEILVGVANGRPELKRRLRMELAAEQGPEPLAAEIDKRLNAHETSRSKIGWRQRPAFLRDLDALRLLIVERLAPLDAAMAAERLWRFMDTARPVGARFRARGDELQQAYAKGAAALGSLLTAGPAPAVAARLVDSLAANPVGWKDWLADILEAAPGEVKRAALDLAEARAVVSPGWASLIRRLAEASGDVDRLAATYGAAALKTPAVAAELAQAYLAAGRLDEAGDLLRGSAPSPKSLLRRAAEPDADWESAWIDYLEAAGRGEEAQDLRWASFQRTLSARHLREFVRRLPDFDDVEAEARAFAYAAAHADFEKGLGLLMAWPALGEASRMVEARETEIEVSPFVVEAWAAALRARYPKASNLLLRKAAAAAFRRRDFKTADRLTEVADSL